MGGKWKIGKISTLPLLLLLFWIFIPWNIILKLFFIVLNVVVVVVVFVVFALVIASSYIFDCDCDDQRASKYRKHVAALSFAPNPPVKVRT